MRQYLTTLNMVLFLVVCLLFGPVDVLEADPIPFHYYDIKTQTTLDGSVTAVKYELTCPVSDHDFGNSEYAASEEIESRDYTLELEYEREASTNALSQAYEIVADAWFTVIIDGAKSAEPFSKTYQVPIIEASDWPKTTWAPSKSVDWDIGPHSMVVSSEVKFSWKLFDVSTGELQGGGYLCSLPKLSEGGPFTVQCTPVPGASLLAMIGLGSAGSLLRRRSNRV